MRSVLALILLFVTAAAAQPPSGGDEFSVAVTFGWQNRVLADRWAPVTLVINSGERTIAGTVELEYAQDSISQARISVPFATTAGSVSRVQILAAFPQSLSVLQLTARDDAGRLLWTQSFGSAAVRATQSLPEIVANLNEVIGVIGTSSFPEALRDWPRIVAIAAGAGGTSVGGPAEFERAWGYTGALRADVGSLPTAWVGYDAFTVLIAIADSARPPDARAVQAIHRWVQSGGRLVIQASAPGEAWRDWVPDSLQQGLTVGPVEVGALPATAEQYVSHAVRKARLVQQSNTELVGADVTPVAVAEKTHSRSITPPEGADWTIHWARPGGGGDLVEARYGYGAIVLVGFDPADVSRPASVLCTGAAWRAVIEPVFKDSLRRIEDMYSGAGFVMTPQAAMNSGLERLSNVPGVGTSFFVTFMVCLGALAVMVGLGDYLLLRRLRALHRSWVTSLTWIAIASSIAFAAPRWIRTESTRINRCSVEDTFAMNPAGAVSGPAFRTGLSGIYAGDDGQLRFTPVDPASWWRSASVVYSGVEGAGGRALVPLEQRAAGGEAGSERGCPLRELPVALWTFRTFTDESVPAPSIRGSAREAANGVSVFVSGVPGGTHVSSACLRVRDKWLTLTREQRWSPNVLPERQGESSTPIGSMDGDVWSAVFPSNMAEAMPPLGWGPPRISYDRSYGFDAATRDNRPGSVLSLSSPLRRERAIDRLVATGHWAALYLEVRNWPMETSVSWPAASDHTRILRVLIPMGDKR